MKYILILLLSLSAGYGDIIKKKTLACPSVIQLQKAPLEKASNGTDLTMYIIANDCVVINKNDKVEAVGYDPLNSKEIYQKILYQKTGVYLFILKSTLQVEQNGKKGVIRF